MIKSRLNAKYNFLRSPENFLYDRHNLTTFFNKPLKQGKVAAAHNLVTALLKQTKLSLPMGTALWVVPQTLKRMGCAITLGQTRKGKNHYVLPLPARRNKKTIIALQELFKNLKSISPTRRVFSLASELLGGMFQTRGIASGDARRKKIYLAYQHRTEAELRRW